MMAPIGIAIVGVGRQGSGHARVVARSVEGARLVGVADVREEVARRIGEELGVPWTCDAAELVARPDVQGVIIATGSNEHLGAVRAAAGAGKDILCEKPLALTLADTDAAIAGARAAGVRLQVGFMRRYDRAYRRAHERIAAGELGTPTLFKSLQFDTEPQPPSFRDPAISGGIFVDMGIHEFDLARWLVGEVAEVHAFGAALLDAELGAMGDVDNAVVNLRFTGGGLGSVELSRNARYGEDVRTEVLCTAGTAFVGLLPITAGAWGEPGRIAIDALPASVPRFADPFVEQARAFVTMIRDDLEPEVTGAESRAALAIALAARHSLAEGRPVRVGEVEPEAAVVRQPAG